MGRGKVKMEHIGDNKSRKIVFKKRRDGLINKLHQLTTLCDVNACIIIHDRDDDNITVWPRDDPDKVHRMIGLYRSGNHVIKKCGVSDFFDRDEKRNKNVVAAMLRQFAIGLDDRAQSVRSRIEFLKNSNNDRAMMMMVEKVPECSNDDQHLQSVHESPPDVVEMLYNLIDVTDHDDQLGYNCDDQFEHLMNNNYEQARDQLEVMSQIVHNVADIDHQYPTNNTDDDDDQDYQNWMMRLLMNDHDNCNDHSVFYEPKGVVDPPSILDGPDQYYGSMLGAMDPSSIWDEPGQYYGSTLGVMDPASIWDERGQYYGSMLLGPTARGDGAAAGASFL